MKPVFPKRLAQLWPFGESHPYYRVWVSRHTSIDTVPIATGLSERIAIAQIGGNMEMAMLYDCRPAPRGILRICLQSAKSERTLGNHSFSAVNIMRQSKDPFILFSDPTLSLNFDLRLAWYLGTPEIDPDDSMEPLIRSMMAATGAETLLIEGSSGGGFAALRLAARFHDSICVPKVPQTDLFRYPGNALRKVLDLAWPGWSYERIMREAPQRFRVTDLYTDPAWNRGGLIRYVQNPGDVYHVRTQLEPFIEELGGDPQESVFNDGLLTVSRPYVGIGHVPFDSTFWISEDEQAIRDSAALGFPRGVFAKEKPFAAPAGFTRRPEVECQRRATVQEHFV